MNLSEIDCTNLFLESNFSLKNEEKTFAITDKIALKVKSKNILLLKCYFNESLNEAISNYKKLTIMEMNFKTSGILVNYKGQDVIKITDITLFYGGRVEVNNFESLGVIEELEVLESIVLILGLITRLNSIPSDKRKLYLTEKSPNEFESTIVKGLTLKMLQTSISKSLIQLINENKNVIADIDLLKAFGIK